MRLNRRWNKHRGNSLIEFAFVLPIMLLITFGIIEFSVLFYDKAVITNASREGARYGIVLRSPSYATSGQITTYVQTYCANKLISFTSPAPTVGVTATSSTTPPAFGSKLTVTVTYTYTDLILHRFINQGQAYNLSATTVMTYE